MIDEFGQHGARFGRAITAVSAPGGNPGICTDYGLSRQVGGARRVKPSTSAPVPNR